MAATFWHVHATALALHRHHRDPTTTTATTTAPPRPRAPPTYRHHDRGPSRGWYNSALVIDATLGVLDIATRAYESRNYRRANTCTTTIVTPPSVVTTQPVAPTVYVPQVVTPQPIYLPQPVQTYTLPATYNVPQPVQQVVTPSGVIYR